MLMYNASHFHLDIMYNVVTVMMTLVISIGSTTAIISAFHDTPKSAGYTKVAQGPETQGTNGQTNSDGSVFAWCNIALIVVLYTIIPQEYPHFASSNLMNMSVATLVFFVLLPIFCAWNVAWRNSLNNTKTQCIGLDTSTVVDFFFKTGLIISIMVDISNANK
jgi:hypothetical protein